jgi:hypothetical protein
MVPLFYAEQLILQNFSSVSRHYPIHLERLRLVCMDLATGSLLLAEVADDRTYPTWQGLGEERLKGLSTGGRYVVRDRAQALIQLAEPGRECVSMPDFLHGVHEIVQGSSLALGPRWRHAQQALAQAKEALARRQERRQAAHAIRTASARGDARQAEGTRWEEAANLSRGSWESLSRTRPPCRLSDSTPQPSAQVASHRTAAVEASEAFALGHQWPARHQAMSKVRKQVPALAARVDVWWQGVPRDWAPFR